MTNATAIGRWLRYSALTRLTFVLLAFTACAASAATYQVGPGKTYAKLSALPTLAPGDIVEVSPGTYNEYKRLTVAGTSSAPITLRGVGTPRPILDGAGLDLNGVLPVPRALIQVEADWNVVENFEFKNGWNASDNGAGLRVTNSAKNVVLRNCKVTACQMGVMSGPCDNVLIESCEIAANGIAGNGYCHNLYLGGTGTTVRFCYIHDSIYGQNFKTRGHYTELLYNYISDSADGELGLVDSADTVPANSNVVLIGNVIISKLRGPAFNSVRFIQFGQDVGGQRNGTLYAINNTFIAGDPNNRFLDANYAGSKIVATNNICYGSNNLFAGTGGGVSGSNNWTTTAATVPGTLTSTTKGADPGFVNVSGRDFNLTSSAGAANLGLAAPTYLDGSGASHSGVPTYQYYNHTLSTARPTDTALDIGAYEYSATPPPPPNDPNGGGGGGNGSGAGTLGDTDGDGFSDELEVALGLSPTDATSTPFGGAPAGTPQALEVTKLQIRLNFAVAGRDSIGLSGTLPIPDGFSALSKTLVVDVGGVIDSYTLDAKGRALGSKGALKISIKSRKGVVAAQTAKFQAKLKGSEFSKALADEGLTGAADVMRQPREVAVIVLFNNTLFKKVQPQTYSAKTGKSGSSK